MEYLISPISMKIKYFSFGHSIDRNYKASEYSLISWQCDIFLGHYRFAAFPCTKTFEKYKNMTYFTKWPQIIKIRKIKWLCTHHCLLDLVVDSTTGRWSAAKEKSGENIIFIVNFGACSFLGGDNLFLALELYPRYGLVAVEHPHGGTWCLWLRSKVGLSKNGQLEIRFVLSYLRKRNDEWTRLLL